MQVSSEDESQDTAPKLPPRDGIPTALTVTSPDASDLAAFVVRSEPVAEIQVSREKRGSRRPGGHSNGSTADFSRVCHVYLEDNDYTKALGLKPDLEYVLQITRTDYSFWHEGRQRCAFARELVRNYGMR